MDIIHILFERCLTWFRILNSKVKRLCPFPVIIELNHQSSISWLTSFTWSPVTVTIGETKVLEAVVCNSLPKKTVKFCIVIFLVQHHPPCHISLGHLNQVGLKRKLCRIGYLPCYVSPWLVLVMSDTDIARFSEEYEILRISEGGMC